MNGKDFPSFDHSVKWRQKPERRFRGEIDYSRRKDTPPSGRNPGIIQSFGGKNIGARKVDLIRQHSLTSNEERRKRTKTNKYISKSSSSSSGEEEEEEEDQEMEETYRYTNGRRTARGAYLSGQW